VRPLLLAVILHHHICSQNDYLESPKPILSLSTTTLHFRPEKLEKPTRSSHVAQTRKQSFSQEIVGWRRRGLIFGPSWRREIARPQRESSFLYSKLRLRYHSQTAHIILTHHSIISLSCVLYIVPLA
jgi:hypothetical protein